MSESILAASKVMAFAPTRDADHARQFYGGTLGLKLSYEDDFAIVYDANGTTLRVSKVTEYTPLPFTTLGWEVTDMAAAIADMSARGVAFERYPGLPQSDTGVMTFPGGAQVAWFKDPDGNTLSISRHPS